MSRLVEDLIPLILDSHDHWWDRDLVRLSLVSPEWLRYVRQRLYASPSLHSFSACAALVRTLTASSYLASLIQHLTLRPSFHSDKSRNCLGDRMAVRTLLALDGLKSLVLGGDLAIESRRFLGLVTATDTLTYLHVDGTSLCGSLSSRASLEWSEDFQFRFPKLKKLVFTNLEMDIDPNVTSQPLQMDELVLDSVSVVGGSLSYLVPEGSVIERLYINASSACEHDEHIRMILHSSCIRSLEYEVQKSSPSDGSFLEPEGESERGVVGLCRLEMRGLNVDNGVLAAIQRHCPDIEELAVFGRSIRLTPEDWVRCLGSRGLSSLRSLALTHGTNGPPYRAWCTKAVEVLTEATRARCIKFSSD